MDISIVIVNYNVKYFLEQCLHSVFKSLEGISGEIIVVDNNSVDGSCQMVREKYGNVLLIENKKNLGFSSANNQGIAKAKGEFVLVLNPDTILQENTLSKCISFMRENTNAGCLGVKMIDGNGRFLPESKRSLPTPLVSFYKIFGLSALFPKSKLFGKYHLGYLDNEKTHKVDVLPGAFMFIRKSVLEQTGLLDETFFMYGEDIDLSYRITKAGYENYYFPETTIIHYKGESTKKGSINYVMVFYKAMIVFARKHFSPKNARLFSLLINLAIYFRASLSIFRRVFRNLIIPLADVALIYAGFSFFKPVWEKYKFGIAGYYPDAYLLWIVPGYIVVWFVFLYINGAYEKRVRSADLLRGIGLGTISLLLIYALLPEEFRYSRALLLTGTVWAVFSLFFVRMTIGNFFKISRLSFTKSMKRIVIAGSESESNRVYSILRKVNIHPVFVGIVGNEKQSGGNKYMGDLSRIEEIIKVNSIDEIIFCAKDITSQSIIQTMLSIKDSTIEYKIAPPESMSVIGSSSINTAGELYVLQFNSLSQSVVKRRKRIFDILCALLMLISYPVGVFFVKKPIWFVANIFLVFLGMKTWVGFSKRSESDEYTMPELKQGVLSPVPERKSGSLQDETIKRLNLLYAKDYNIMNDLSIIARDFRHLGNK